MKIKYLLIYLATIKWTLALSQAYLPINPGRLVVFENISEEQSYIRVDSVSGNGTEMLYLNRVVDYSKYDCVVLDKPSWLGEKLMVYPNGYCCFFNKNNDTITIKHSAHLNESWIAYSDSSIFIEAQVYSHEVQGFLGLGDSVKTIGFKAFTINGNAFDHWINNMQLALSKNYGMVQALNFLNFSDNEDEYGQYHLVGLSEPKVGVQNLTWFDVFDFKINDEIHVFELDSDWEGSGGRGITKKCIFKYIDRKDYTDSIIYKVDRAIQHRYRTMVSDSTWATFDTIKSVIKQNENFNQLPGYPVFDDNGEDFIVNNQYNMDGLVIKYWSYGASKTYGSACWSPGISDGGRLNYYYKALGGPYYKGDWGAAVSYERSLIYYKKGNLEWGSAFIITDVETMHIANEIKVYPNPANGFIYVDIQKITDNITFELYDLTGRLVLRQLVP
jgi:hypothetical protein